MKDRNWFVPQLALTLMVLVTLACGASTQATATKEAATTGVPAATLAPQAAPDLSTARISLKELPQGYQEIDTQKILASQKASGQDDFAPEGLFAYVNPTDFHMILGMDFLLVESVDKLGFNMALSNAKNTLPEFAGAMGGQNVRETKALEGLETLGEKQAAMTMLADVQEVPMRVNAVMFRRGIVGGLLLSMTIEGKPENIPFQEVAELFDQHIQESLKIAE
jgi:hypothetical protein